MHSLLKNKKTIALMVAPGMILFLFAVIVPIIMSVYLGMTDWSGIGDYNFVGLKNYKTLLTDDPAFVRSILNALTLAVALIVIQHPLGLCFAILLDYIGGRLEKIFRAIFFIPCVVSVMVVSKLWVAILNPTFGLVNNLLDITGFGALAHNWLSDPKTAMPSLIVILMYQGLGWCLLYYYAGIKGISGEMYEAARIDGCGFVKMQLKITIPMLKPVLRVNLTLAVISALKQMETVFLTTRGGPGNQTQFLANYLYKRAFDNYEYGYGNAIAALFVIICFVATYAMRYLIPSEELQEKRERRRHAKRNENAKRNEHTKRNEND